MALRPSSPSSYSISSCRPLLCLRLISQSDVVASLVLLHLFLFCLQLASKFGAHRLHMNINFRTWTRNQMGKVKSMQRECAVPRRLRAAKRCDMLPVMRQNTHRNEPLASQCFL